MKQLKPLLLTGVFALLPLKVAMAATLLMDDFDSYVSGSYIQNQGGGNWSRFGQATADGIYSVAQGVDGTRAARYQTSFNTTTALTGSVRYTFSAPGDLSTYDTFALDISVNTVLPGTAVYAQIASGGGTPTILETSLPLILDQSAFTTYAFTFTPESVRVIQGSLSVSEVLENLGSVTFRFYNGSDVGSQSITFDQFVAYQAIPEPTTVTGLAAGGLLLVLARGRRRAGLPGSPLGS